VALRDKVCGPKPLSTPEESRARRLDAGLAGHASGGPVAGMYCTHDGAQAGRAHASARDDAPGGSAPVGAAHRPVAGRLGR